MGNEKSNIKKMIIIAVSVIAVIILITYSVIIDLNRIIVTNNTNQLITKLNELGCGKFNISSVIDFEWDEAYVFGAYVSEYEQIEVMGKQMGIRFGELDSDGSCILAFLNNGKVVCYVEGLVYNTGFYFVADTDKETHYFKYKNTDVETHYFKFKKDDNLSFNIERIAYTGCLEIKIE